MYKIDFNFVFVFRKIWGEISQISCQPATIFNSDQ